MDDLAKGDEVLVHGQLVRRFYRSGAGARSLTEVVATRHQEAGARPGRSSMPGSDGGGSSGIMTMPVRGFGQK